MTRRLQGIGVSVGCAAGPVVRLNRVSLAEVSPRQRSSATEEGAAALDAVNKVAAELSRRADVASGAAADVLRATALIAADPALWQLVGAATTAGSAATDAISAAFEAFSDQLRAAGPYFAERVADLEDVRDRVLAELLQVPMPGLPERSHPYVLVASDLAPADTALMHPDQVIALVTERGGPTSHTAVLARALGVPAVVACPEAATLTDDDVVLVDGGSGSVVLAPDDAEVEKARARESVRQAGEALCAGPGRTADGHPVELLVNLGAHRDLAADAATDAEGVGLFRTEFLFLDRHHAPTFDEQRLAYQEVFSAFEGRKVVVRTLDAGGDKPMPFLGLEQEPNPALGIRGLRTTRRSPDVLATQLKAIAAASASSRADVWLMAPMVSTTAEAAAFVAQAHEAGLPVAGVMVEVPALALRAGSLEVDFVSIGTNDLAQYAFAADRMAGDLADLLDYWQPALLDLIAATCEQPRGRPVGVCGEAAGDPLFAAVLVGLGITSLSMAATCVPTVRAALSTVTLAECQAAAREVRAASDAPSARETATALLRRSDPLG